MSPVLIRGGGIIGGHRIRVVVQGLSVSRDRIVCLRRVRLERVTGGALPLDGGPMASKPPGDLGQRINVLGVD